MNIRTAAAAVLAFSLCVAGGAFAQGKQEVPILPPGVAPNTEADIAPERLTVEPAQYAPGLLGRVSDSLFYYVAYMWESVMGSIAPPAPTSFASDVTEKDPYSFWTLLSDAGYKLKEIETDVGLIPDVSFKFKHVRELSEADVTWLERKLEKHAKLNPDWISALQRSIVFTLLQINDSNDYFVETLTVAMLPLPKAKFSLEPWEGGLPEEFDILLRAIQGREITPRRGPRGGS